MPLVRDAIIAFVKERQQPICAACLTKAFSLPFDRILDAWSDLQLRGDLPIHSGLCSGCGQQRAEVIWPRLP